MHDWVITNSMAELSQGKCEQGAHEKMGWQRSVSGLGSLERAQVTASPAVHSEPSEGGLMVAFGAARAYAFARTGAHNSN